MDTTTNTSASEPQSSKPNEASTLAMPSSDQHSPDVITETNSSSAPARASVAKSPIRSFTQKLKSSPFFAKSKGKDKAVGKEKEREITTTTAPAAEGEPMAGVDAQEGAGTPKKVGLLKDSFEKVTKAVKGLLS